MRLSETAYWKLTHREGNGFFSLSGKLEIHKLACYVIIKWHQWGKTLGYDQMMFLWNQGNTVRWRIKRMCGLSPDLHTSCDDCYGLNTHVSLKFTFEIPSPRCGNTLIGSLQRQLWINEVAGMKPWSCTVNFLIQRKACPVVTSQPQSRERSHKGIRRSR